jgi:hypothetical protein
MAETNWTFFGASAADVTRGVTAAFTKPNGGGNFTFGFNSKVDGSKVVGAYYNATNFAPLRDDSAQLTGGSIRGALMRSSASTNPLGFTVGLFINLAAGDASSNSYVLALSNDNPSRIILAKLALQTAVSTALASTVQLRTSSATYVAGTWLHLRLDSICNPNGDVVLSCKYNNLATNPVTAPVWESIPGMNDFIDDSLAINTGINPLAGGYLGYYFQSSAIGARAFVDHIVPERAK